MSLHVTTLDHLHVGSPHDGAPLVVVLHGRGDSLNGFAWLPTALGRGYQYLLLNAPDRFGDGWSWYARTPHHVTGILRSRDLVTRTLAEVELQGVPAERTALFGFSQGCLMAIDVALRYRRPLGAVLGFAGYVGLPELVASERTAHAAAIPWRLSHGRRDDVLPIGVARDGVATLRAAGLPVEWREHDGSHAIDEDDLDDAAAWLARHLPPAGRAPVT